MTPAVLTLAGILDEAIVLHQHLVELSEAQRMQIAAGETESVSAIAREIETSVMRLVSVEERREVAAQQVADELGLKATRWSAIREVADAGTLMVVGARVERLEALVRELELSNAINGQLIRRELELVDYSIRGLLTSAQGAAPQRYTSGGRMDARPASTPVLLNTTA